MAEAQRIMFELREIAQILVEKQGIKEGHWGIAFEIGFAAMNVPVASDAITPAAVNTIQRVGIQRFAQSNNLTVDASALNKPQAGKKASKKAAKKK
jgi:hypothetical protein